MVISLTGGKDGGWRGIMTVDEGRPTAKPGQRRTQWLAIWLGSLGLGAATCPIAADAQTLTVKVDARCKPWSPGMNPRLSFGVGDGRPPVLIVRLLPAGGKVRFEAKGQAGWLPGGQPFDPDGDPGMVIDRSIAFLPSHHIVTTGAPLGMIQLVGAFVDADGVVVGRPFGIGKKAEVEVPEGAAAISLGVNDDAFADNFGSYDVTVHIPQPSVIVEDSPH